MDEKEIVTEPMIENEDYDEFYNIWR